LARNYKYIHVDLVQVGIKPLTKEGLNTSIIAVLCDARFQNFQDSLLSSIESSLCSGPVSFDCYPNITISLKDKNILQSMLLQIKTHNYDMLEGSIPVALKSITKPCSQPLPANTNSNLKKEKHSYYKQIYPAQTLLSLKQSNGKTYPYQKIGSSKVQHHQNYHHHLNPMSKLKILPNTQMEKSNCLSTDTLQVPDSQKRLSLPVQ
jgi:hypothetical protein